MSDYILLILHYAVAKVLFVSAKNTKDYWRNVNINSESKTLCHYTFVHNFDKCWPIFKIL